MSHTLPAHRVGRALGAILGLASVGLAAPVARAVDYPSGGWTQGQPPRLLMSENDGFCFLNRVTGEFRGSGEKVLVYHTPTTDKPQFVGVLARWRACLV